MARTYPLDEIVGEIFRKDERVKCVDGITRTFEGYQNKCHICGKPSREYGFNNPSSAAIGLRAHLRRVHQIYDGTIQGWNDDEK